MTEGFVDRRNAYRCPECGGMTITIDVDDGVTPMFLGCRASGEASTTCDGMAVSLRYPSPEQMDLFPEPAWEWYRPTPGQQRRLKRSDPQTYEHVRLGGLMLRKRKAER